MAGKQPDRQVALCPSCGAAGFRPDSGCGYCGAKVALKTCSACKAENPPQANFCANCGLALKDGGWSTERAREPLASAVPEHMVERIHNLRSELTGARKLVTVMFADIRGSFELTDGRDP